MSQPRPKVVIPVFIAVLAGFLGAGIWGAFAFSGSNAAPQHSTVTVQQVAATAGAQPTATVTKTVTVKTKPAKTTQKVNALTAQSDPQSTDSATTDAVTEPLNGGSGGLPPGAPRLGPRPTPQPPAPTEP